MIFSKSGILMGGLTLVPAYKKQPQNHPDVPVKHVQSFLVMRKS